MEYAPATLTKIIDRSLPEIYPLCARISRLDMLEYCWMLKGVGVDIAEISSGILSRIGKLPEGLEFIVRVNTQDDVELCVKNHVKRIVLQKPLLSPAMADMIAAGGLEAALEARANSAEGILGLERLESSRYFSPISCIRLLGLDAAPSEKWLEEAVRLRNVTGKSLDICAGNRFYSAAAIAYESVIGGMDFVTASFNGFGRFAPLEELLAAMMLRFGPDFEADLSALPRLSAFVTGHAKCKIPHCKPVIGDGIFVYESGIHAAAIEKNPAIYEPFEPSLVGRKRELAVGKHSGRRSVLKKISQLGLAISDAELPDLLESIRNISIQNGRSLKNEELLDLCRERGLVGR